MTRCAGLRSEINLSPESAWGKQLTALRADVSKVLTAEIELMPGRVRRLIRPRPSKEIASGSRLDADEVAETEALIGFVAACRNYASELAINEVTQRTFNELQQFLDTGTARAARCAARGKRRRAPVPPVAGRCRGAVLRQGVRPGIRLAAAKAAEVASHDHERKAAARGLTGRQPKSRSFQGSRAHSGAPARIVFCPAMPG